MNCRSTQHGMVLIVLLWVLAGLSLLALNLAYTVRTEATVAQATGEAEKAYFCARGGLEAVIYRLAFPDKELEKQKDFLPYAEGMNHYWFENEDTYCHVAILDEAGKLDLNYCKEDTLERLMTNLGVEPGTASTLASAIIERRDPSKAAERAGISINAQTQPRLFAAVEELMHISGMNREILYGAPRVRSDGSLEVRRGLAEYVTVYTGQAQVNLNYAEPEVIAALPGMSLDSALSILEARQKEPFTSSSDLSQRTSGLVSGEALSQLSTQLSGSYCLVATAWLKDSKLRRSIKATVRMDSSLRSHHSRQVWYDEYWPLPRVLKWAEPESKLVSFQSAELLPFRRLLRGTCL